MSFSGAMIDSMVDAMVELRRSQIFPPKSAAVAVPPSLLTRASRQAPTMRCSTVDLTQKQISSGARHELRAEFDTNSGQSSIVWELYRSTFDR